MNWIEKIRNKPAKEKIGLIWGCVIVAAALLIILWVVTWHYKKTAPKDTSVFQTFSRGIKDVQNNFKTPTK
jgi:hypothetical protein